MARDLSVIAITSSVCIASIPFSVSTCLMEDRSYSFCHTEVVEGEKIKRFSTKSWLREIPFLYL
jgi:hypothetical protein